MYCQSKVRLETKHSQISLAVIQKYIILTEIPKHWVSDYISALFASFGVEVSAFSSFRGQNYSCSGVQSQTVLIMTIQHYERLDKCQTIPRSGWQDKNQVIQFSSHLSSWGNYGNKTFMKSFQHQREMTCRQSIKRLFYTRSGK